MNTFLLTSNYFFRVVSQKQASWSKHVNTYQVSVSLAGMRAFIWHYIWHYRCLSRGPAQVFWGSVDSGTPEGYSEAESELRPSQLPLLGGRWGEGERCLLWGLGTSAWWPWWFTTLKLGLSASASASGNLEAGSWAPERHVFPSGKRSLHQPFSSVHTC